MQDNELYRRLLGIESPWEVVGVDLDLSQGEVRVRLEHTKDAKWACAECGKSCALYDHQGERRWRHLDTCQYRTVLVAAVPRTRCAEHGVRCVRLPWAEPSSRFTELFEALAISLLRVASQSAAAEQLRLSWDEVHLLMGRAVKRGLERREAEPVPYMGVDEKAFRKGHKYLTIVNDLRRRRVLYVVPDRKQSSLDGFWKTLSAAQLQGIEAMAMDMWEPYLNSARAHLPEAEKKIVFDKFHIAQYLNKAVDQVRRQESKTLYAVGDNRLKGTRYLWLRNPANATMDHEQRKQFQTLRDSHLKTARAWALKETAMSLFDYTYQGSARKHFDRWYNWAVRSKLKPMAEVARMMRRKLDNILTYLQHRVTNAASEALNSKIQWVKYTARGFRNQKNFITAIYFHCAGLSLAP